ncbi:MAG TPA: SusC/RagA family TonB-linked outer membrane protein [Chitinophaga sp.]|uniref:SusC/RagA family TonB-linked outer membrane protein n=1 Tax=Chitinophaga sp. TaxID=1869181 RepID=UPI002C6760A5|nr:SusC/RagA family TonB-linked outer membrane protein [Chitinophaga sp.]HVI43523.1 SusC/RagA family TonB-linked outer membrane protein [Chitinophaga sp.]
MKKVLSLLFSVLLFTALSAQTRTVNGRVTDAKDGSPLPGVSVNVKGSNTGTITAADGTFRIQVPEHATISFSFVGYEQQDAKPVSNARLNIALRADLKGLQEVVVTGVGTATDKRRVAIAVDALAAKDLPKVPSASIDQALVGKIAGAQITSLSGQPGQQAGILLRGINTLSTTQPMIVVDGVQINAGNNNNGSAGNLSSRLSDLDLSNVERIEVVQGSAAATLYGAQGANGVIQIFTRKGAKNSKPKVVISSRANVDNAILGKIGKARNHFYNTDSEGYIVDGQGRRLKQDERGGWAQPGIPTITGELLNNKPYKEKTFDHLDQTLRSNVLTTNNNINISGGGPSSDYLLSVSNLNQQSIITGNYNRTNLTVNAGTELFKNFTVRNITQVIYSNNKTGGITGRNNVYGGLGSSLLSRQFWDLEYKDADGNYVANPEGSNSVNPLYTDQYREYSAKTTRVVENINLNYKFPKFVEVDYKFGIDNYRYDFTDFIKYQLAVKTTGPGIDPRGGRLTFDRDNETFTNSLLSVFVKTDFKKDFGWNVPVNTSTQFAYDWRKRVYQNVLSQGTGFASFPPYSLATANSRTSNQDETHFITYGYLINQRIDYGELFGISGGVRVDYSSAFGAGSKPFVFPRGDAYFRLGELLKIPALHEFKLRGAYGEAGIQPRAYDRMITLNSGLIGDNSYLSVKSISMNPDLEVEQSKETEIGTDIGLHLSQASWFQHISFSATYWKRNSNAVIRELEVAPTTGAASIMNNAISIKGEGFQFSLDADMYTSKNLDWRFGIRFGKQKSVISNISNHKDVVIGTGGSGQFVLKENETVGAFFGKKALSRIDQVGPNGKLYIPEADKDKYTIVNGMVVNKTTKAVQFTTDQVALGDPTPKFNMSFINNFTLYRNLSLSFQIDWVYGHDIYNQTKQWMYRDLIHKDLDQPITIDGKTGAFVGYYNSLYNTNTTNSYFVEKGSYARLRDVTVSYDFARLMHSRLFSQLLLSLSGRNLATISNYSSMDPESAANLNDPIRRGLDLNNFPNVKSVQLGLTVGF